MVCHCKTLYQLVSLCITVGLRLLLTTSVYGSFADTTGLMIIEAHIGDRVTLPCEADSKKEVDWRYLDARTAHERFVWNRNVIVNGYRGRFAVVTDAVGSYNLTIYPAQRNDSGHYQCIENGGFGKSHQVFLYVHSSVRSNKTVVIPEGETASLNCDHPYSSKISWLKNGQDLFSNNNGYTAQNTQRRLGFRHTDQHSHAVVIHNTTTGDSGVFTCDDGFAQSITNVTVREISELAAETVTVGQRLMLECDSIHGQAVWLYRSLLDNESHQLTADGKRLIIELTSSVKGREPGDYKNSLLISDVQTQDAGVYTCVSDNRLTQRLISVQTDSSEAMSSPVIISIAFSIVTLLLTSVLSALYVRVGRVKESLTSVDERLKEINTAEPQMCRQNENGRRECDRLLLRSTNCQQPTDSVASSRLRDSQQADKSARLVLSQKATVPTGTQNNEGTQTCHELELTNTVDGLGEFMITKTRERPQTSRLVRRPPVSASSDGSLGSSSVLSPTDDADSAAISMSTFDSRRGGPNTAEMLSD